MLIYLFFFYSFYFENEVTPPRNTLIFIDKTESVKYVGGVLNQAKSEIKDLIVKHFYRENDKIVLYFIHGFTAGSKANQKFDIFRSTCKDRPLPKLHLDACNKSYLKQLNVYRNSVVDSISKTLEKEVGKESKNSTDIIGAIEMVCNYRKNNNKSELQFYIFSDMIQTSNFINLNNMGQLTPANLNIKIEKDLKTIKTNYLNIQNYLLKDATIHLMTPDLAINTPAHMKNLKYYWEKVFLRLGITSIIWDE